MKKLIVTADDYGVFPSINEGVRQSVLNGKVNSVACFSNYKDAVANVQQLMNETGNKAEMGCHLTISSGKPLVINGGDTFTHNGYFRDFSELNIDAIEQELPLLNKELSAQVEVFLDAGIPITHLSCHHTTLTTTEPLFKTYLDVARKYKIPIRSVNIQPAKKDTNYRLVLKFMLLDDLPFKKRKEVEAFGRVIRDYMKTNAPDILSPGMLESSHYGPLPMREIFEFRVPALADKKRDELRDVLGKFVRSELEHAELMVHLIKTDKNLAKEDSKIDYPGVNKKYFDSRQVEYESINGIDFGDFPDIVLSGWGEL